MRGVPVRQSEVFEAADALVAAGESPTIERVRGRLGRGSNSTLAPFLREWHQNRLAAPEVKSLLGDAPAQVSGAMGRIAEQLLAEARREVDRVRAEAEEACAAVRAEAAAAEDEARAAIREADQRAAEAADRAGGLEAENRALGQAQIALGEKLGALEVAHGELARSVAANLDRAQASLRELTEQGRAELRSFTSALRADLERGARAVAELRVEATGMARALAAVLSELSRSQRAADERAARHETWLQRMAIQHGAERTQLEERLERMGARWSHALRQQESELARSRAAERTALDRVEQLRLELERNTVEQREQIAVLRERCQACEQTRAAEQRRIRQLERALRRAAARPA